jgi:hypothetical protein
MHRAAQDFMLKIGFTGGQAVFFSRVFKKARLQS